MVYLFHHGLLIKWPSSSSSFKQEAPPGSRIDRTYLNKELCGAYVMAHQREAPTATTKLLKQLGFEPATVIFDFNLIKFHTVSSNQWPSICCPHLLYPTLWLSFTWVIPECVVCWHMAHMMLSYIHNKLWLICLSLLMIFIKKWEMSFYVLSTKFVYLLIMTSRAVSWKQ